MKSDLWIFTIVVYPIERALYLIHLFVKNSLYPNNLPFYKLLKKISPLIYSLTLPLTIALIHIDSS